MNPTNLPQMDTSGVPEIFRLLRIGETVDHDEHGHAKPEEPKEPKNSITNAKIEALKSKALSLLARTEAKYRVTFWKSYGAFIFYPLVFIVAFGVFYVGLNFPSITAQVGSYFTTKSQAQEQLGTDLDAYYKWMRGYYYSLSDTNLLAPNSDVDKDGLTNLDEYTLKTNPTVADSDGDGVSDGVEVLDGTNWWGSGNMSSAQKKLREQINLAVVSDRIASNTASSSGASLIVSQEDKFDLNRPGQLSIPKLNLQVSLIWSKDPSDFDADLEKGVIHYPGTALPGETGVVYVSGHSSDYIWKHNPFSTVFTKINRLSPGDDVFVTVYGADGKSYVYRYQVTGNKIYSPDDQTQFLDNSSAKLNLSTCWPIGTSKDRLVVSAQLVSL